MRSRAPLLAAFGQCLQLLEPRADTQKSGLDVAGLVLVDTSHAYTKPRMAATGLHLRDDLPLGLLCTQLDWTPSNDGRFS